jgi:phage terminase small subunit
VPALDNARHERFAQSLAKGRSQSEAYAEAGYAANDGNAARLKGNERVLARVAEILDHAAIRTEISVASITQRLLAIASKGERSDDAPMLQAARASLMDAAKLNGLVVDKSDAKVAATVQEVRRIVIDPRHPDSEGLPPAP